MALVVKDRVKETTTTTGTGTLTLAGAMSGFQAFSVIGNTNTTYYAIYEPSGTAWEVGIGTYTLVGTTLSRDTILASSNAGSAVNFGAGTKVVFCTYPAGKSVYYDASGNVPITGALNVTSASATSFAVGLNGTTNPAFTIDASTASQAAGFKITGAATGGTVALVATDSGSNTSLTFNAKGTGTISIGSVSTGDMIFGGTATASRRVEINTNGQAIFAYGDNSLTTNVTLQNLANNATTNHGSSILWRLCTNSSSTAINSGRIAVIKEQLWTSTASTQDSAMTFATTLDGNMAEKMRINSSGSVGINTSSPTNKLQVSGDGVRIAAQCATDTASSSTEVSIEAQVYNYWGGTGGPTYTGTAIQQYGAAATGTTCGLSNANLGVLRFQNGGDGLIYTNSANNIVFGISSTERMRINSSGYLLIGYTTSNGAYPLQVNGQIFATSSTIATSDGKYKTEIQPLTDALSLVAALNPVQFKWKKHPVHSFDTETPTVGFIAQEIKQVLSDKPYLNNIVKTSEWVIEPEVVDDEGNVIKEAITEEFLGIAEGNLIALLTKAIQELKIEFDLYKSTHP